MEHGTKYVDLHVHSTASDGTLTPSQVVDLAVKANLSAIALTDHDTLAGVKEAISASEKAKENGFDIEIIPGTELSVGYKGKDIHMLGLFLDYKSEHLNTKLEIAKKNRDQRNIKMVDNLASAGFDITMEKLIEISGDAVLTRAHFARFLLEHGYVKSMKDAFDKYIGDDSPYYVKREYLSPKAAIDLIHDAGGLAILAHPLIYKYTLDQVEELIDHLYHLGLDGVEIIHSSNTGFDEGHLRRMANKRKLLYSGGSDFHGSNKPNLNIGVGYGNLKIKEEILSQLKDNLA